MIIGFFGLPRSGKTYLMSYYGLQLIKKGFPVYSNYPLRGAFKLEFRDVVEGVEFKPNAVLLLTELHNYASSREWQNLSPELFFLFSQGGKMDLRLFYDAQDSSRVDKILRENTNYFYEVSPLVPKGVMDTSKLSKYDLGRRVLVVDVYKSNYEYSSKKGYRRFFHYIRWSVLNAYNSFYFIKKYNVAKREVSGKWLVE